MRDLTKTCFQTLVENLRAEPRVLLSQLEIQQSIMRHYMKAARDEIQRRIHNHIILFGHPPQEHEEWNRMIEANARLLYVTVTGVDETKGTLTGQWLGYDGLRHVVREINLPPIGSEIRDCIIHCLGLGQQCTHECLITEDDGLFLEYESLVSPW